jgi:hypothetical protein
VSTSQSDLSHVSTSKAVTGDLLVYSAHLARRLTCVSVD